MSYTYDPKTDSYVIPSRTMARMIYRIGSSKEKIAAEDAQEAEKVRARARGELREKIEAIQLYAAQEEVQ